jgi:hypothetical protein
MRKTEPYTITSEGRDKGKVFLLQEMPAMQAEKWAGRALMESGVQIPDELADGGMEALMAPAAMQAVFSGLLGGLARLRWESVEPLLDEMMTCVRVIPDPKNNCDFSRPINQTAGDIEEVATLFQLRGALLKLHTGFSPAAAPSTS